jgi:hypothetical protein
VPARYGSGPGRATCAAFRATGANAPGTRVAPYKLVQRRSLALVQGTLYVATGLWPIVHYRSFERATGPKRDVWLVKTTGGLIAAIGASLLAEGRGERPVLGLGSAAVLATADIIYGGRGRISRVYLLDALAELALVGAWLIASRSPHRRDRAARGRRG